MKHKMIPLVVSLVCFLTSSVYADHSAELVFNNPSSYIGLWETTPSMAILTVTADFGTPATQAIFHLTISHDTRGRVASGESSIRNLNAGPSTQQFMADHIINWHNLEYDARVGDPVYRSGRLPEGEYTAEVEIRDLQGMVLAQAEASFTIRYPEPPELIAPSDADVVLSSNPAFQWTPVMLPPGHPVTYYFKVVELLEGQAPERAIELNLTHHEARISGATILTYPIDALPFERGKTYVWQVQALDEHDLPASTNEGKSDIWTFTFGDLVSEPGIVADSLARANLEITVNDEIPLISAAGQTVELDINFQDLRSTGPGDVTIISRVRSNWYVRNAETEELIRRDPSLGWEYIEPRIGLFPGDLQTFRRTIIFDEELLRALLRLEDHFMNGCYLDIRYEFEITYPTVDRWGESVRRTEVVSAPDIRLEIRYEIGERPTEITEPTEPCPPSGISFTASLISPMEIPIYTRDVATHEFVFELDASGFSSNIIIQNAIFTAIKPDGSSRDIEIENPDMPVEIRGGESSRFEFSLTLSPDSQEALLSGSTEDVECEYRVTFCGVEAESSNPIRGVFDDGRVIVRPSEEHARAISYINVVASPGSISYPAEVSERSITYEVESLLVDDTIELDTIYTALTRGGRVISSQIERISTTLPAGGSVAFPDQVARIDREAVLGGDARADCQLITKFTGTKSDGKRVRGQVEIRATVTTAAAAALGAGEFVLIPDVAIVRPTTETTITSGSQHLNGHGLLVLLPNPFDSLEVPVTFHDLTFAPDPEHHDSVRVSGGRLDGFAEGDGNLFTLYSGLLMAKRISFDAVRDPGKELKLDEAHADLPGREPLVITNIIINKNGMSLHDINLEYTLFGLTLRITDIQTGEEAGKNKFSMTVYMRLQGRDRSEEFCSTTIKLTEEGAVECRGEPEPEPFQIIPHQDYLLLNAIELMVHPDSSEFYASFTVSLNYPSPLEELGPTEFTFKVNQDGECTGEVVIVRDEEDEDPESDRTKLDFGDFATLDLTYAALRLVGSGDGFDYGHSFVALSGDFVFHESADSNYTVHFGDDEDEPGVRINFDGSVDWHNLMLARNRRINLGPVYIKLATLGFEFSPRFAFVLSGGLGVNKEDVFSGEVMLETLKVFSDGSIDFDNMVIRGGSLSIMDFVSIGLENFDFCDDGDCEITCKTSSSKNAKDTTFTVDNYFQLEGASINIGDDGDIGSGEFEELLVYTAGGENNFVLRQAEVEIAGQVEIKIDLRYVVDDPILGSCLSVAGALKIDKTPDPDITGAAYGRFGRNPGGEVTGGVFLAAGGLGINIGPVTLNELGGGFFYNPLTQDLDMVRELCRIDRPEITDKIAPPAPAGAGDPGSFAGMVFAGLYVASADLVNGRALLTITERNVTLDAAIEVLDGKGEGACYLAVGWDPSYLEGNFVFKLDLYSIIGADVGLMFYVYDEDTWAVMGNGELQVIPSLPLATVEAEFFVGPPGFLLDLNFDVGFDIGILAAHAGFENMYWWNQGVSWGAYLKIYVDGEILWGLVGVAGTLEGALLGTEDQDWLIYCVGSFYAELCWVTVFDGSVWITLSGDGLDGGEGRNAVYDEVIDDARNMADQMREDMDEIGDTIEDALAALEGLSETDVSAAGVALLEGLGGDQSEAHQLRQQYANDAGGDPMLLRVKADILQNEVIINNVAKYVRLQGQQESINPILHSLGEKHQAVTERMQAMGDLITGTLPSVEEVASFSNPVGAKQYETVNIGGRSIELQTGFSFDETVAEQNAESTNRMKQDIQEYQNALFEIIVEYENNLKRLDEFMGPSEEPIRAPDLPVGTSPRSSDVSPNELSQRYAEAFDFMNEFFEDYLDLIHNAPDELSTLASELEGVEDDIRTALQSQADTLSDSEVRELADSRGNFINDLLTRAGLEGLIESDDSESENWKDRCVNRGMLIWYEIPLRGLRTFGDSLTTKREPVLALAQTSRSTFISDWANYTNGLTAIHERRSRLHELLYDLYDQLSLSATQYPPSDVTTSIAGASDVIPGASGGGESTTPGLTLATGSMRMMAASRFPSTATVSSGSTLLGQRYPNSPRGYFARKRDQLQRALVAPRITSFSGNASSSNPNYAHVDLQWTAIHPTGIADISYRVVAPAAEGSGLAGSFSVFTTDIPWRTVGPWANSTRFALLKSLDRPGSYTLYLRAAGAGGYSITRRGQINVAYFDKARGTTLASSLNSSDDTPPTTPVVEAAEFTANLEMLYASWRSSDPESGIEEFQYRIRTPHTSGSGSGKGIPGSLSPVTSFTTIRDWTSASAMPELNIRDLELQHNHRYYIEVKAKNGVGLWSSVGRSDGVLVDTTAASRPSITQLFRGVFTNVTSTASSTPIAFSGSMAAFAHSAVTTSSGATYMMGAVSPTSVVYSSGTEDVPSMMTAETSVAFTEPAGPFPNSVSAAWSEATDPESGVIAYFYALGTHPNTTDFAEWTLTDRRQMTIENLPIAQGDTCYFMVRAINGAGKLGPIAAQSLVVEYVDATPPLRAPRVQASYDAETDSLTLFWYDDGGDPESGIVEYKWAIGHQAVEDESGTLVQDWRSAGKDRGVKCTVHLPGGFTYYVKVKAINGVGLYRVGFSEPIHIPLSSRMRGRRGP